ncbi:hypothetical protein BH24ACI3_BH24ACI3_00750 [soil metagenome]
MNTITLLGGGLTGPRTVMTNIFGHYRVDGLSAGQTYIVSVQPNSYTFAVDDNAMKTKLGKLVALIFISACCLSGDR